MQIPGIGKLVGVNFGDKIDEHVLPVLDKLMDKLAAGVTKAKKKARGGCRLADGMLAALSEAYYFYVLSI